MSSRARKTVKGVLGGGLCYPVEMYNTTVGSIVICGLIFTKKVVDKKAIRHKWVEYKKSKDLFSFEDPKLIDHVLEYFGLERPKYFPIAMVQSELNVLFCPYDKKRKMVYPLREDGFTGPTIRYGKVYPIDFDKDIIHNRLWLKDKIKSLLGKIKKCFTTKQVKS